VSVLRWGEMTAPELGDAAAAGDVVLLPIGAVEQHGPHLPTDVDIRGAIATAEAGAARMPFAIIAPPVWWGLSGAHKGFPGLLNVRVETFLGLLDDLCDSMVDDGFKKIVLVVGHGSNKGPVAMFVAQYQQRTGVSLLQLNYLNLCTAKFQELRKTDVGGDFHAGEAETALTLHLAPELVKMDRAVTRPVNAKEHFGLEAAPKDIFKAGEATIGFDLKKQFPEGVMGDAVPASADTGAAMFEQIVDRFCEIVTEYHALEA
jgi:creatinine amidohydrolase